MSKENSCAYCDVVLQNNKSKRCSKEECKKKQIQERYLKNKHKKLIRRPCPCCGKTIPNKYDEYCSDNCVLHCEAICETERKFVKANRSNIIQLAKLAKLLPENNHRLKEIEDRLHRKYGDKYKFALPCKTMLCEFGFTDEIEYMSQELYNEGLLTGSTYWEVAYDISIYRKLFDYGVLLKLIE